MYVLSASVEAVRNWVDVTVLRLAMVDLDLAESYSSGRGPHELVQSKAFRGLGRSCVWGFAVGEAEGRSSRNATFEEDGPPAA